MPINSIYSADLESGSFYHIFNRSHSDLVLFEKPYHYSRFLNKTEYYLHEYMDFFAYSLIPNHFHYLVRVKNIEQYQYIEKYSSVDKFLTQQFKNLFISHTKYINETEDRHGGLFCTPFRIRLVEDENYFERLFYYIHWNHVHHGIARKLEDYTYSSYSDYRLNLKSFVNKEFGYAWFGGKEHFLKKHQEHSDYISGLEFENE